MTISPTDRAEISDTRAGMHEDAALEVIEPVALVRDLEAGSSGGSVPCRLVVPEGEVDGLLVFFHGGGFVYGDRVTHEPVARRLANRTGWAVLVVDYRRAAEHPFPAAVEDADSVAGWLASPEGQHLLGELGVPARFVAMGDSAGGNLALGMVLRHPTRFVGQVLVYPFLDPAGDTYDRQVEADFSIAKAAWFWGLYLQGVDPQGDVRADPLQAESLAGLPRALIQLAEHDILTPTGKLLADRLAGDEVLTNVEIFPDVHHGFWRRPASPHHEPALADVAAFLAALS